MNDATSTYRLVVNPSAGRGKASTMLPRVIAELGRLAPRRALEVRVASDYADARRLANEAVAHSSPSDALLVMGGDGMTSIGLNAVAESGLTVGIIPAGTGNDFCRGIGLPFKIADAIDVIVAGHIDTIDLMSLDGELVDGTQRRWVGSILSTGFDEKVNWRTNHLPFSIGAPSYAYAVIAELATFRPLKYRIVVDGVPRELDAILIAVGNAGVFGGGMRACPDADVTDGLLDVTIVHPVGRGTLIRLLPRLFDGSFVTHPAVETLRAREVVVDGDHLHGMADGEEVGCVPFTCRVVPAALSVFRPVQTL